MSEENDICLVARAQGLANVDEENAGKPEIKGICRTCSRALIMTRGDVEHRETIVRCGALDNQPVPHDIVECTGYWRRGQMALDDMQEIALLVDKRKGPPTGGYR
jgi:hypothetical protein